MKKALQFLALFAVVAVVHLALVVPAFAFTAKHPDPNDPSKTIETAGPDSPIFSGAGVGASIGAGLAIVGAGLAFGKIGSAALESMARQPEIAGKVLVPMIAIAALLEGATLFALVVCLQVAGKATF